MSEQRTSAGWSSIDDVLAKSIQSLPAAPDPDLHRINLHWSLAVGEEMATRSRVVKVCKSTLKVEVMGPEWVSVVRAYQRKILAKLNKSSDFKDITSITIKQVEPAPRKPVQPRKAPAGAESRIQPMENNMTASDESLKSIADPELRGLLSRLGTKLRFVALACVSVFILTNCASTQKSAHSSSPSARLSKTVVKMKSPSRSNNSYAVRQVQALNKKYPDKHYRDPRAYYHYLKGYKFEREGDFDEAARHYSMVMQYDPTREDMHTHLVELFLRTGQFDQALESGKETLKHFPNNLRVRLILGDILSSQKKHQEALDHYKKVVEIDPGNARAYLLAGYNLRAMKQYDDAREHFKQATMVEPANPLGYHYLGSALARTGEMENAEEKFKKSLNLRPSFIEARENLARVLELQKKYSEAVQQYKIILKLKPNDKKIRDHLKEIDQALGAEPFDEANTQAITPLEPGEVNIHTQIGAIFYEQAVYLAAVDEFRLALANEENKELRLVIAKIYELLGRMDKAITEVEAYRQEGAAGESIDILLNLARLYGLNKEMKKSIDLLKRAVKMEPNNDRLYHALALAHMSLNQNKEALTNINQAIKLNDKKDTYFFEQGALLERLGRYDEAIASMTKTLEINSHHSNAHNFIGYIYATQGIDLDKALSHLEQALTIQPRNGYFLDSLGWIYYKKGEPGKALTHIKKAMVYAQPDPVLYDHLGDVYFAMENMTEARKAWKTSLALTLQKLDDPAGETPDPQELREKIRKADQKMLQSF